MPVKHLNSGERHLLNHPSIKILAELERSAAQQWWATEDRTSWRHGIVRNAEKLPLLSLKTCLDAAVSDIFIYTWDADIARCFSLRESEVGHFDFTSLTNILRTLEKNQVMGIFPRPGFWLSDSWTEKEDDLREALQQARRVQALIIRCGFTTDQADILMAADLGFTGIQIHAGDLDIYQLQLLVELARDCHLSPIVSIENAEQLETALQTDAPHLAFCCLPGGGYELSIRFLNQSLPRIPKNCTKLVFTALKEPNTREHFRHMGLHAVLSFFK